MKQFIQLRGPSGVGKSTVARQFISRNNFETFYIKVGKKQYPYSYDKKRKIVVTGEYNKGVNAEGLDGVITDKNIMLEYLTKIMQTINPETIVFEAVMYGSSTLFGENINKLCKAKGYKYKAILLYSPIGVEIERIMQRNGGKTINENDLFSKSKFAMRSIQKLKAKGINTKIVDTSRIPFENMYKVIENEL